MTGLIIEGSFTSIRFSWRIPEESNGIILHYGVSYRVDGSSRVEKNVYLNRTFAVSDLKPMTKIREFAVFAVNSAGPSKEYQVENIVTAQLPRKNIITMHTCTHVFSLTSIGEIKCSYLNAVPAIIESILMFKVCVNIMVFRLGLWPGAMGCQLSVIRAVWFQRL